MKNLKTLDELKEDATKRMYNSICSQIELYNKQEQSVVMALLEAKEKVWIEKESGAKVEFSIEAAIKGLSTISEGIKVKKSIFKRISGISFDNYKQS